MKKLCTRCKKEKAINEFGRNIRQRDGYHYSCNECERPRKKAAKYIHRYGITIIEKEEMIEVQRGRCAICKEILIDFSNSLIDHDHKTGRIRAILCNKCNTGLGMFNDNADLLNKAALYLASWNV